MNAQRVRPILRWPGGKSRHLKIILPMIKPHVCFCEHFFGGGAVTLAKERSSVEVINDINGDLVALYRNLQFHLPALIEEIEWFSASRKDFEDFREQRGLTEIQRAARLLLVNRTSFAGKGENFGIAKTKPGIGFNRSKVSELMGRAHERLNGVVIEHLPYERCLENYDSKDTFHFIDPPYVGAPTKAYDGWDEAQAKALRKRVGKLKGNWLITLNDSPSNRAIFAGCEIKAVSTQSRLCNNRTHSQVRFGELIITPK